MAESRRTLKRYEIPGNLRFLTFSCYRRLPLIQNDAVKAAFVDQLSHLRGHLAFELFAWVVMPEHVHLLIRPNLPEVTVTRITAGLKRPMSQRVLERWRELDAPVLTRIQDARGKAHFWQRGGGYDRNLVTPQEVDEKVHYIHDNPCRRGLVERAEDYRWSSMRRFEGIEDLGPELDPIPQ